MNRGFRLRWVPRPVPPARSVAAGRRIVRQSICLAFLDDDRIAILGRIDADAVGCVVHVDHLSGGLDRELVIERLTNEILAVASGGDALFAGDRSPARARLAKRHPRDR
jgi:hypothetical protein